MKVAPRSDAMRLCSNMNNSMLCFLWEFFPFTMSSLKSPYNDNIIQLEKLDITGNVSDHYPLFFTRAKELYKRRVPKIVLLLVRLDGPRSDAMRLCSNMNNSMLCFLWEFFPFTMSSLKSPPMVIWCVFLPLFRVNGRYSY
jgi:hypothetical protein